VVAGVEVVVEAPALRAALAEIQSSIQSMPRAALVEGKVARVPEEQGEPEALEAQL